MDQNTTGKFNIYNTLPNTSSRQSGEEDKLVEDVVLSLDLIDKSLKTCDRTKLSTYRFLNIAKAKTWKKSVPERSRKTCLSLHERRKLGLYHLKRSSMKFNDALALHDLWKQYFSDALNIEMLNSQRFSCMLTDRAWDQVSMTLYRADYHGAFLQVIRSKCASLVGLRGIVLMDTKNTFKLICEDNIVKTIPKVHCVFSLVLGKYKFTIFGKSFCTRPAERSVKKLKSHTLADL